MSSLALEQQKPVADAALRRLFWHLYFDIGWFGVLNGTSIAFVAIFAARQGASAIQVGLLNAAPGLIALVGALPAGQWLRNKPLNPTVFWASVLHRAFYIPWIFVPLLWQPGDQVWILIAFAFIMSVPGTILAIAFNGLFAAAVPDEYRAQVVGRRNALFALMSVGVSLGAGYVLNALPGDQGYVVVFALGALGGAMSSLHIWFVRPLVGSKPAELQPQAARDWASPGSPRQWASMRLSVGWRYMTSANLWRNMLSLDALRGPYGRVVLMMFLFHTVQHIPLPLFPIYVVNNLGLSDAEFSIGNSLFYVTLFFGSMQLAHATRRWGSHKTFALGALMMSFYPLFVGLSTGPLPYMATCLWGGISWALAGGALLNYVLDQVPADNRPPYLAWYNLAANASVLTGSLVGPLISDLIGLPEALYVAAGLRVAAAVYLWRKGRVPEPVLA